TFLRLMQEINSMRNSGELLERGKQIRCPVLGIHGDYDPHPAEGVRVPLAGVIADFWWVLLKNCGHTPWNEQEARDNFYLLLKIQLEINERLFTEVQ
ncbi:MAG TPA: alpha/beta hydrolase, partial [Bacillota bacterium]|nr:alpha/beta hydrolase [Bacillota bacterium]